MRGAEEEKARERLAARLRVAAAAYSEPVAVDHAAIRCILGDVEEPDLGVDPRLLEELRGAGIDTFWHFAANLSFEEEKAEIQGAVTNDRKFDALLRYRRRYLRMGHWTSEEAPEGYPT